MMVTEPTVRRRHLEFGRTFARVHGPSPERSVPCFRARVSRLNEAPRPDRLVTASLPSLPSPAPTPRVLSLDEANGMLPLVQSIALELQDRVRTADFRDAQLHGLEALAAHHEDLLADEEISDVRDSILQENDRITQCVSELESLGVSVHRPLDGGVDFPGLHDGKRVSFCWLPGEASVTHYHQPDQGRRHRQKIAGF